MSINLPEQFNFTSSKALRYTRQNINIIILIKRILQLATVFKSKMDDHNWRFYHCNSIFINKIQNIRGKNCKIYTTHLNNPCSCLGNTLVTLDFEPIWYDVRWCQRTPHKDMSITMTLSFCLFVISWYVNVKRYNHAVAMKGFGQGISLRCVCSHQTTTQAWGALITPQSTPHTTKGPSSVRG